MVCNVCSQFSLQSTIEKKLCANILSNCVEFDEFCKNEYGRSLAVSLLLVVGKRRRNSVRANGYYEANLREE